MVTVGTFNPELKTYNLLQSATELIGNNLTPSAADIHSAVVSAMAIFQHVVDMENAPPTPAPAK